MAASGAGLGAFLKKQARDAEAKLQKGTPKLGDGAKDPKQKDKDKKENDKKEKDRKDKEKKEKDSKSDDASGKHKTPALSLKPPGKQPGPKAADIDDDNDVRPKSSPPYL